MPGEMGNFAVAGHRVGKGAPFNDLGKLETCDDIVVETHKERITYRVLPIDGEQADCLMEFRRSIPMWLVGILRGLATSR